MVDEGNRCVPKKRDAEDVIPYKKAIGAIYECTKGVPKTVKIPKTARKPRFNCEFFVNFYFWQKSEKCENW